LAPPKVKQIFNDNFAKIHKKHQNLAKNRKKIRKFCKILENFIKKYETGEKFIKKTTVILQKILKNAKILQKFIKKYKNFIHFGAPRSAPGAAALPAPLATPLKISKNYIHIYGKLRITKDPLIGNHIFPNWLVAYFDRVL